MSLNTMMIHTCSTQRNAAVGTNGRRQFQNHLTGQRCYVRPLSAQQNVQLNFEPGTTSFIDFPPGTDVTRGDRVIHDGINYLVTGAKKLEHGRLSYLQVLATTEHANGV